MALYRNAHHPQEGRRLTQADLAAEVGLHSTELSKRLNGSGKVALTSENVRATVRALAKWGVLQTQAEAVELLRLAACPPFSPAQWQQPPLDRLTPLNSAAQSQLAAGGNLPLPLTSFIGRMADLAEATTLLADTRLLTVIGPGGIGKTRFVTELARQLLGNYPDGIYLVELAQIASGGLVAATVAASLGVREEPGRTLIETLIDRLRPRHLLLVFDNCEHLLGAAGLLAAQLLSRCPQLTIIATSREPLGATGEISWLLPPLALPAADDDAPEQVRQAAAAQLFIARARAANPGFHLTAENAAAIAAISHQLEGLPLAIELAAPLVRTLTVEQLTRRLADRLRLLQSDEPALPVRQRTLQASIAWSYDLLAGAERTLLRRLAVFAGGWELEAAEVVCGEDYRLQIADFRLNQEGHAADVDARTNCIFQNEPANLQSTIYNLQSSEVLAGHVQLVNKSLVQASEQGGAMRYRLLESIREYALGQLARSDEADIVLQRHAQMFLALAEQGETQLAGANQVLWLNRLEQEHDNFRAALAWSVKRNPPIALRLTTALAGFWHVRGYLSEGRVYLAAALAADGGADAGKRAKALYWAGRLALAQSDYAAAARYYAQAQPLAQAVGDHATLSDLALGQAFIFEKGGDYPAALALYQQSLAAGERLADARRQAEAQRWLGNLAETQGDYPAARQHYEAALHLAQQSADLRATGHLLSSLGSLAYRRSDYAATRDFRQQALTIYRELQEKGNIAATLHELASTADRQGDYTSAQRDFEEALRIYQELGSREGIVATLDGLADIAYSKGDYRTARKLYRQGLALYRQLGKRWATADALHSLGMVATAAGDLGAARAAYEEALIIFRELGERRGQSVVLLGLADVAAGEDDRVAARVYYHDSLLIARDLDARRSIAQIFIGLAGVMGNDEAGATQAARLLGAASALLAAIAVTPDQFRRHQYERHQRTARRTLGASAYTAAWQQGQAMPLAAALDFALAASSLHSVPSVSQPQPAGSLTRTR